VDHVALRARVFGPCVAFVLLAGSIGVYAQSTDSKSSHNLIALKRKAASGDANAEAELASDFYLGKGVPEDHALAAIWYRKAAEQGHSNSQLVLGAMCDDGDGTPQDHKEAVQWYQKAAEQGNIKAEFYLAIDYQKGQGVPVNATQAANWYRKAAEQGDADSQNNLGVMYLNGEGVAQDDKLAKAWFKKAADQGSNEAKDNLKSPVDKPTEPLSLGEGIVFGLLIVAVIIGRFWLPFIIGNAADRRGAGRLGWVIAGFLVGPLFVWIVYLFFVHWRPIVANVETTDIPRDSTTPISGIGPIDSESL
jgi:hypothetical protein